jgi:hypothetical protein
LSPYLGDAFCCAYNELIERHAMTRIVLNDIGLYFKPLTFVVLTSLHKMDERIRKKRDQQ